MYFQAFKYLFYLFTDRINRERVGEDHKTDS